ncbi:DUF4286 family protein [Pseudoxanthomonas mexicana]|uniref:DUF4286 family protein n=1 Tax=Pseudoxanthomonas mexicana TaxID=128785 RepID=UPI00398A592D
MSLPPSRPPDRGGVIYEVTLDVEAGLRAEYEPWLHDHVRQMLALPGFTGAEIGIPLEPPAEPGRCRYCVAYRLVDQAALQAYLRDHAAAMRADGLARFGERFRASRRVLEVVARY